MLYNVLLDSTAQQGESVMHIYTYPSFSNFLPNGKMDKEDVVHIYNGIIIQPLKRDQIGSFVETWMDLEMARQTEVSQKKKNKYHILTHMWVHDS